MKMLRARLYDLELKKRKAEQDERRGRRRWTSPGGARSAATSCSPTGWSRTTAPAQTVGDADGVLDGAIDPFIEAYLKGQMAAPGKDELAF